MKKNCSSFGSDSEEAGETFPEKDEGYSFTSAVRVLHGESYSFISINQLQNFN